MKRIAKIIGFVGGAAAVIWAMRDRFISVATSREPEPPSFRPGPPPAAPVEDIDGIGPVFAERLSQAGLGTIPALADASPDNVAEAAGVSAARARTWIDLAKQSR
ncbi:MAG TPA: helix-hairpin-helix domain-containing protein [Acidimicrobiia bacterium]|nr:helix-hairpin-helix domain-containing protein [Acidimicrobiia bacterium]